MSAVIKKGFRGFQTFGIVIFSGDFGIILQAILILDLGAGFLDSGLSGFSVYDFHIGFVHEPIWQVHVLRYTTMARQDSERHLQVTTSNLTRDSESFVV